MTIRHYQAAKPETEPRFVLPDPPKRADMTTFEHLHGPGNSHHLIQHFGNRESTIVSGERYIIRSPGAPAAGRMAPDLLIALGANPEAYRDSNGYVISEQGKPPDFVLEIASRSTGRQDVEVKRTRYADLEIPEYWRFDHTGEFHGARLAGDQLADGQYEPVPIETVGDGILQGYSAVLNLFIRWEHGQLGWHDPETGQHIATFDHERAQRQEAQAQRQEAEARADTAEARIRELEAELARRDTAG